MKIAVGFSRSSGIIGALIRWVIKAPYNHTYFYLPTHGVVWEANSSGVECIKRETWEKSTDKVVEEICIDVPESRFLEIVSYLDKLDVKKYGWSQLWSLFINKVSRDGDKRIICSELVARVLAPELGIDDGFDNITPRDIYFMVKTLYHR